MTKIFTKHNQTRELTLTIFICIFFFKLRPKYLRIFKKRLWWHQKGVTRASGDARGNKLNSEGVCKHIPARAVHHASLRTRGWRLFCFGDAFFQVIRNRNPCDLCRRRFVVFCTLVISMDSDVIWRWGGETIRIYGGKYLNRQLSYMSIIRRNQRPFFRHLVVCYLLVKKSHCMTSSPLFFHLLKACIVSAVIWCPHWLDGWCGIYPLRWSWLQSRKMITL